MIARSVQKNIRMSPRKLRRVINQIRGLGADVARNMLRYMPYAAARIVEKNLLAAIANAEVKMDASEENLVVSSVFADEGTTYKRWRPRAQGRAYTRLRRTSHLTLVLSVKN